MYSDEWQLDICADHFVMYPTLDYNVVLLILTYVIYQFYLKKKKKKLILLVGLGNIVEIFLPLTKA